MSELPSASKLPLRIRKDMTVLLDWVLYDDEGEPIEATDEIGEPVVYVHGYGTLLPGLERGLVGLAAGESKEIFVPPKEGYGLHDESLEIWVDRCELPETIRVGDEFEASAQSVIQEQLQEQLQEQQFPEEVFEGTQPPVFHVVEITDDSVLLDQNHPLAGETLHFDVIVHSVRPATDAEIAAAKRDAPKRQLPMLQEISHPELATRSVEPEKTKKAKEAKGKKASTKKDKSSKEGKKSQKGKSKSKGKEKK